MSRNVRVLSTSQILPILFHCIKNMTNIFSSKVLLSSQNQSKTVCFLVIQWLFRVEREYNEDQRVRINMAPEARVLDPQYFSYLIGDNHLTSLVQSKLEHDRNIGQIFSNVIWNFNVLVISVAPIIVCP